MKEKEDNIKEDNTDFEEQTGFIPTVPREVKYYHKIKYGKTIAVAIALVVAVVAVGIVSTYQISASYSDADYKAAKRNDELAKIEKTYDEQREALFENIDKTLNNNYSFESYTRTLRDIKLFEDEIDSKNWYNQYSEEDSEFYETTKQDLRKYKRTINDGISADLKSRIEKFKPSDSFFDKDGDVLVDKVDSKSIISNGLYSNKPTKDDDNYTGSQMANAVIADLDAIYSDVILYQTSYDIFENEDFKEVIALYDSIRASIEKIYSSALNKETADKATEEAEKKFNEEKDKLKEEIEDQVIKETTEKVTEELEAAHKEETSELNKRIEDLESENKKLSSDLKDMTEKYNSLNQNQKKK